MELSPILGPTSLQRLDASTRPSALSDSAVAGYPTEHQPESDFDTVVAAISVYQNALYSWELDNQDMVKYKRLEEAAGPVKEILYLYDSDLLGDSACRVLDLFINHWSRKGARVR